jgi:hypothetical protein
MPDCPESDADGPTPQMTQSPYDTDVVEERARQWRAEAARATLAAMRTYCLAQADECERRVQHSLSTPILLNC